MIESQDHLQTKLAWSDLHVYIVMTMVAVRFITREIKLFLLMVNTMFQLRKPDRRTDDIL